MTDSLGRWLLRKLRPTERTKDVGSGSLPEPTGEDLRAAREELVRGGSRVAENLLELLVAADQRGGELRKIAWREVAALRPSDWLTVDLASRRSWWSFPAWWRSAIEEASRDASSLCVLVASFHPDGHVREATTARLSEIDDPHVAAALALRCVDWVPQVRDRARHAFERRLNNDVVCTFKSAGEVALLASRRQAGGWLANVVEAQLRSATDDQIDDLVRAPSPLLRRAARAVAVGQGRLDLNELLAMTKRERDLPSRLISGRAAIEIATHAGDVATLRNLATDNAVQLRQAALQALDSLGHEDEAAKSLFDRAGSVRTVAQYLVRSHGRDPAVLYREDVATTSLSPWTIAGIGETGTSEDRVLIEPALADPRPRVRAEAIRALRRLNAVDPGHILPFLADPSPAVAKQASTALLPHARAIDERQLSGTLGADQPTHARRGAYRLLRASGPWTRLATNLQILGDPTDELQPRALIDIRDWLARESATTYMPPSPEARARLAQAIDDHADLLGVSTARALRFHTKAPLR